ncbi:MAG TPA: TldD/PmbA family protein [Bryobacterales bacterium]|nr:TldD/PmbA family protein [Bryobacterales bacterium]
MQDLALLALDRAVQAGASYADVRLVEAAERYVSTKNGKVGQAASSEMLGLGVRVIAAGAWGFAATDQMTAEGVQAAATRAVAIARASALVKKRDVALAPEGKHEAAWASPVKIDPFTVSVDRVLDLLLKVDAELRRVKGVTLAEAAIQCRRLREFFANSEGSRIDQTRYYTGAGYVAHSFSGNEIQKRSYPNSFGGQHMLKGWELVEELRLLENAQRVGEEAVALHSAEQCPEGVFDLILDGSQVGLQIHESIGHPIELDRVLGTEANFAGMSFLTLDKLRKLKYASDIVNVVCDARPEHGPGLGTFAFDDEGIPAQSTDIIKDGLFVGYMTSRETAAEIGETRSNGTMRADGWNHIPLIRMTNVSIKPGKGSPAELIGSTGHGIYMETNRSWSIDDKRYHFQFGTEIGWEIKNGKKVRMLKNPSYSGITTEFWNSCDAICGPEHWTLWGTPNCGKGQPQQTMGTGHGASPARFRQVKIGGAYA